MDAAVRRTLLDLNRVFYAVTAHEFSATRQQAWPGFDGILPYIPTGAKSRPLRVLDVGCGNGRFASYLADQGLAVDYLGVDASPELLDLARGRTGDLPGVDTDYRLADLADPDWTVVAADLAPFDLVACFATFHHLPGSDLRQRVLADLARLTAADGIIAISYWQFLTSDRLAAKLADWSEIGLSADQVEPGDALLPWKRGPYILRYVHQIEDAEARGLAATAHLTLLHTFRADGKEGDLNLYHVLGGKGRIARGAGVNLLILQSPIRTSTNHQTSQPSNKTLWTNERTKSSQHFWSGLRASPPIFPSDRGGST